MKKSISTLAILIIAFVFTATASAQRPCMANEKGAENCPRMHHKWAGGEEGADSAQGVHGIKYHRLTQLDLSDAQKTEVANILADHRDNNRALADQLKTAKTAFFDLVHGDVVPTEAAIRQAFKEMSRIKEDLMVNKFNVMSALKNLLTEDQFAALTSPHAGKPDPCMRHHKMNNSKNKGLNTGVETRRNMMDAWIDDYADK